MSRRASFALPPRSADWKRGCVGKASVTSGTCAPYTTRTTQHPLSSWTWPEERENKLGGLSMKISTWIPTSGKSKKLQLLLALQHTTYQHCCRLKITLG